MSYKHKTVAEATVLSEEYIERVRRHGHPNKLNTNFELVEFRTAIENKYIKTMHRNANTAYVYIEGEQMVLGWIGYGDFQSTISGASKYVVYTRNIRNMRHVEGTDEYFMRSALRLDKAVKNCNANLIRYTSKETGCALAKHPKRDFVRLSREADEAYMEVQRNIGLVDRTNTELGLELITLIKDGYVFRQPELHENISKLSHLKEQYNKHSKNNPRPMDFVRVYKNPREELCADVVKMININAYSSWGRDRPIADRVSGKDMYLAESLPESILGKIAVMAMCEDGQFVEDVGYKVDDTMFYFYPEEPTT
tara:strand:- start:69 stop:998 length:930 start_codon:yes stop_codon:yes gene_type:complete